MTDSTKDTSLLYNGIFAGVKSFMIQIPGGFSAEGTALAFFKFKFQLK